MRSLVLRYVVLFLIATLVAACGGGGGSSAPACAPNGNLSLHSSSTGTALLTSITVTALQNALVPPVSVFIVYANPPVGAILAGHPPGA